MSQGEPRDHVNEACLWGPAALDAKRRASEAIQAKYARVRENWIRRNEYFYDKVRALFRFIVPPGQRVLDIRCSTGWLLDAVRPSIGVGIEITQEMVDVASAAYPAYQFLRKDPEEGLVADRKFDYVILEQPYDTVDLLAVLKRIRHCCEPHTRLIIYDYNHLWQPVMQIAERTGLKMPLAEPNWLREADWGYVLNLAGFERIRTYREILLPKWVPVLSEVLNRFVAYLPLINRLCMIRVIVGRPVAPPVDKKSVTVSVIVPCKNESGNVEPAVERIPAMGASTEVVFCDDRSTDGTAEKVREMQRRYPDRKIKLVRGPGICKAENVWTGFSAAAGDLLMILDADLAVMPEELPYFFDAIVERKGELISGTRLVYPIPRDAMRTAKMIGNKAFSLIFSYLLDQPITDTLCGTKVLWKSDWERIKTLLGSWGVNDHWGDYELLFGATRLNLLILELPVHYQERIHGVTKMVNAFSNGLRMLAMCGAAFVKLKMRGIRE